MLSAGIRLGPYEIVSRLGARGMGEVHRARDPRLGRDVAIKVLLDGFASDADRLRRFEHEAGPQAPSTIPTSSSCSTWAHTRVPCTSFRSCSKARACVSACAAADLADIWRNGRVLLGEGEPRHELRGEPDGIHERSLSWLDATALGDLSADGKTLLFSEGSEAVGPRYAALYLRRLADPRLSKLFIVEGLWQWPFVPGSSEALAW